MLSSVNTKELLFTRQHDYSLQCFPCRLGTVGLTFPHGAVGSLEMQDKEVPQSFLDYLMPLVPEVVGQSPPFKKKKIQAPSEEGRKAENIPVPSG